MMIMMMLHRYVALLSLLVVASRSTTIIPSSSDRDHPLISPCPHFFTYERMESDRWYGIATLLSDKDADGVFLSLTFDRHILQIGNWFGKITRLESDEYQILNGTFQMKAHQPYPLRFFVRYDPHRSGQQTRPQLIAIRLNGETICPEDDSTRQPIYSTRQPIYSTSPTPIETVSATFDEEESNFANVAFNASSSNASSQYDDDIFIGDVDILLNPKLGPGDAFKCGTRVVPQPSQLKTYGHLTHRGEFPWHAALYYINQSATTTGNEKKNRHRSKKQHSTTLAEADLHYICGATLITTEHVITAARCVMKRNRRVPINWEKFRIFVGMYYRDGWRDDEAVQHRDIFRIFPHSDYSPDDFSNDIAIIQLVQAVVINDYVRPVCLCGDPPYDRSVFHSGIVAGWGFDEDGWVHNNELMQARMSVKPECINELANILSQFSWSGTYCVGFPNGTAMCIADSGSGMVYETWDETKTKRIFQLRGVFSVGVALQKNVKCSARHYTVFTNVDNYIEWINKVFQQTKMLEDGI